ncbi:endo alpha-1,4 polygalactosaminidase [Cellulomonas shaoxiangyii]|uniref:endo alpha-1,4 polygalactosaminidase n=1 Tax=Cellulomonas shaoxiangyii TaxID=2566013 RepID=UPI001ABEDF9C|nr:endo alpha-1,4 polygalactosaminidase [Cellulomonas shaoxiangyii]
MGTVGRRRTAGAVGWARATAAAALVALVTACGAGADASPPRPPAPAATGAAPTAGPGPASTPPSPAVTLPRPGAPFEYQLGGADAPEAGTEVVVRDATAAPSGRYDVCYVNGFQSQPGDTDRLLRATPELVLHDDGEPVADPDWPDEVLLDVSTPALRERLVAELVGPLLDRCAAAGSDAVEVDNLDSWTRSHGLLDAEDAVAFTALLVERAHAHGLAYAQKNAAEVTDRVRALGADLVVAEDCARWDECATYTDAYPVVLDVEYDADAFAPACAAQRDPATALPGLSLVLRDLDVLPRGARGAVHAAC